MRFKPTNVAGMIRVRDTETGIFHHAADAVGVATAMNDGLDLGAARRRARKEEA